MPRWLKSLLIIAFILGMGLWIGVHFEVLQVGMDGVQVLTEDSLADERDPVKRVELLINRGNLYFRFFQYEDALRLYCRALFNENPSFKKGYEYKPGEGEVDLRDIADELGDTAKKTPEASEALFNAGVCYLKLGKVKEAIMVFDAFVQLYPYDPLRPYAERNAQDLRLNRL